ncbi:MAG: ThiF family adenylyltransferase [Proteobacteria bacterium]|nr:ThiF family adenylyltransferase [Pseudomonadota bacterium]
MKLKILASDWHPFADALCARTDVESAGIILAERLPDSVLLARRLTPLADAAYAIRKRDRIRIDPVALNRLVKPARERGLSVFTVHTHPAANEAWFSTADDLGDSVLMPSLLTQMDGPHGSLVIATNSRAVAARAWYASGSPVPAQIHLIGKTLRVLTSEDEQPEQMWFDRQRLALGESGQRILRQLHVGVVGLGGTGSVTFAQLVHLGVGRITVIDGDRAEATNISRILGARTSDAGVTWKVDIALRYATNVGLGTEVTVHRGRLGAEVTPAVLGGCDAIFSCVDAHLPRALLNRLAYEKAILLFDMGSAFRITAGSPMEGAGRVVVTGPGRRCLACWGHIDPNRIRVESLPPDERARQQAEGYVAGADVPQPSVVAFNTQVAGAAVIEFLRCVTEFCGADDPPDRLSFDFGNGSVRRNRLAGDTDCGICHPKVAA